ncbi:MAG TPA: hypothetical protein VN025_01805 [Candidatus Dormibacteraeota bacterium]|jgi:hypothetical protein|nr:hypothetical protein [Candidatus Dormibacteraeota bacterium]
MISNLHFARRIICLCAISLFAAIFSFAQTQQDSKPDKKEENAPSAASPTAPVPPPQKPLSLKEAVQKKKVLTEDDLSSDFGRKLSQDSDPREFNAICNPRCEQIVRDQMMTDNDSELEFRNKFTVATQQIDDDHKWGNAVVVAIHAADVYCDLEHDKARYAYPGARPPFTSDKMPYDFIVKERDAYYKFKEMEGAIKVRIQNMQSTDPFRASVMQSQWAVALSRSCHDVEHL